MIDFLTDPSTWLLATMIAVWAIIDWKVPRCGCGKSRRWYYFREHERSWVMWLRAAWIVGGFVWSMVGVDPWCVVLVPLIVYFIRRAWFHDRDKGKRDPIKAAGRVVVDAAGRLRVVSPVVRPTGR